MPLMQATGASMRRRGCTRGEFAASGGRDVRFTPWKRVFRTHRAGGILSQNAHI
jgi:hypothetical protein